MGLAYFFLFFMLLGSASLAAVLLTAAWKMRRNAHWAALTVLWVLGGLFVAAALYLLAILWREPPWRFHF